MHIIIIIIMHIMHIIMHSIIIMSIMNIIIYYTHERVWNRVSWGKVAKTDELP
jgi:uncharacterized membrane protein